jgi:hypothetical protein
MRCAFPGCDTIEDGEVPHWLCIQCGHNAASLGEWLHAADLGKLEPELSKLGVRSVAGLSVVKETHVQGFANLEVRDRKALRKWLRKLGHLASVGFSETTTNQEPDQPTAVACMPPPPQLGKGKFQHGPPALDEEQDEDDWAEQATCMTDEIKLQQKLHREHQGIVLLLNVSNAVLKFELSTFRKYDERHGRFEFQFCGNHFTRGIKRSGFVKVLAISCWDEYTRDETCFWDERTGTCWNSGPHNGYMTYVSTSKIT